MDATCKWKSQLFRTWQWGCKVLNFAVCVGRDRIVLKLGDSFTLRRRVKDQHYILFSSYRARSTGELQALLSLRNWCSSVESLFNQFVYCHVDNAPVGPGQGGGGGTAPGRGGCGTALRATQRRRGGAGLAHRGGGGDRSEWTRDQRQSVSQGVKVRGDSPCVRSRTRQRFFSFFLFSNSSLSCATDLSTRQTYKLRVCLNLNTTNTRKWIYVISCSQLICF